MTILHLTVDIPSLICEYFYVDKVVIREIIQAQNLSFQFITAKPEVFVPMKSILAVIENVFAGISIIMVEVKSQRKVKFRESLRSQSNMRNLT